MAICLKCQCDLPDAMFHRNVRRANGLHAWCKSCDRARKQTPEYRSANSYRERRAARYKDNVNGYRDRARARAALRSPEEKRRQDLWKNYRMTVAQEQVILQAQGGCCAICKARAPGGRGTWHVDHDHATGFVRGLLCTRCNNGLGSFRDNARALDAGAAYLRFHGARQFASLLAGVEV